MDVLQTSIPVQEDVRLSTQLKHLLESANGRGMKLREIVELMHGRGLQIIVVFLCLPFLSPVGLPGISIPFGLAIAVCGLRIAFGHKPWLPDILLRREVSYSMLEKMVHLGMRFYGRLEKWIRPRWTLMIDAPGMTMLAGLSICFSAIVLSLPIPPPFPLTNTIPGIAIILISLGLMERDGVLIGIGHFFTALGICYASFILLLGTAGFIEVLRFFGAM